MDRLKITSCLICRGGASRDALSPVAHGIFILCLFWTTIFFCPPGFAAKPLCKTLSAQEQIEGNLLKKGLAPFLVSKGFDAKVSKRLQETPSSAATLTKFLEDTADKTSLDEAAARMEMIEVYRGLDITPDSLSYDYTGGIHNPSGAGAIFVSPSLSFAFKYALGEGLASARENNQQTAGVILEMQLPVGFLEKQNLSDNNSVFAGHMPNIRPFIKRIGVVQIKGFSNEKIYDLKSIKWLTLEAFEKNHHVEALTH